MSTYYDEIKQKVKEQIEAQGNAQKEANKTAYNEEVAGYESAAQTRKDNIDSQVTASNKALTERANKSKQDTAAQYDEIYDTNAVNQYIAEHRVAENMANMGLTDSGLNATQLTAIQTSRGNADNRARLQEQKAIETIEFELSQGLAENEQSKINYFADIDANLEQQKATASANLTKSNAAVDSATASAITEAHQQIDDEIAKAEEEAAKQRSNNISNATTAVKSLWASNSDYGEQGLIDTVNTMRTYAMMYGMSDEEILLMCNNAGISYSAYLDPKGAYQSMQAAKAQNDSSKERVDDIKAATTAIKNLSAAGDYKGAKSSVLYYAAQYGLSENEIRTMCGQAGINYDTFKKENAKAFSIIEILSDPSESTNYEAAFKAYNITETGRKALVGDLMSRGILNEYDAQKIEDFWSEQLSPLIKRRNDNKGSNTEYGLERSVHAALQHIQSLKANTSANAIAYMVALLTKHGFEKYIPSNMAYL